jgi:hypothetical protein
MAKTAKAACPVCGVEISDPDYANNRARNRVLKCPTCSNNLVWVKPAWERWAQVIEWLIVAMAPLVVKWGSGRIHNHSLRRWSDYTVFAIAGLAFVRLALEKLGLLKPGLKVTHRAYEDPTLLTTRESQRREVLAAGPKLTTDWRGVPTRGAGTRKRRWLGFLRGKGAPPLEEPVSFDSETGK